METYRSGEAANAFDEVSVRVPVACDQLADHWDDVHRIVLVRPAYNTYKYRVILYSVLIIAVILKNNVSNSKTVGKVQKIDFKQQ